jgi:hypothetical protein
MALYKFINLKAHFSATVRKWAFFFRNLKRIRHLVTKIWRVKFKIFPILRQNYQFFYKKLIIRNLELEAFP